MAVGSPFFVPSRRQHCSSGRNVKVSLHDEIFLFEFGRLTQSYISRGEHISRAKLLL